MRNCLFRFKAKFRETASLFRKRTILFSFVFREIQNETSFAGIPTLLHLYSCYEYLPHHQ
jgi:hypothetical protein